jgi:hypothetical protein
MKIGGVNLNKLIKNNFLKASLDQVELATAKIWSDVRIIHE